jgi:hypothetical protein
VAFSPDGARAPSGSSDDYEALGTATGSQIAILIGALNQWQFITLAGFFDASDDGLNMAGVVRGSGPFSADQFRSTAAERLAAGAAGGRPAQARGRSLKLNLQRSSIPAGSTLNQGRPDERAAIRFFKVRIFNNEGGGNASRDLAGQWPDGRRHEPTALQVRADCNGPVR